MDIPPFDRTVKSLIKKIVDYAGQNVYDIDDLLDMMNGQKEVPGRHPEHLVLVPFGLWICYYLVDHPHKGRCHYFQIKGDVRGNLPGKPDLEYIVSEFGIDRRLLDEHTSVDKAEKEVSIIIPLN